ncbi:MAG: PQQ-dependent sugar dehydrogenase [Planctomycetota bacterium]|nr:PQQ-dependent sugar dehydrogenase [Planctomycetota bacterium]
MRPSTYLLTATCVALTSLGAFAQETDATPPEDRYYAIDSLPVPDGVVLEVGGLGFLSDGRMVVSTRRGQVWIVAGDLSGDLTATSTTLFADGLFEGLGLAVLEGDRIFVLQRHELSELIDDDGDGRCDRIRTVADGFGMTGNYHEFAFGLPVDRDGNFYVSLNLGFFNPYWYLGRSNAPYRGWVLRISPDGEITPWASGFRSPNGINLSPDGDLFVTDNQGDWLPACPVHVVERGKHYGHPASLDWREDFRAADRTAEWYEPMADVRREPAAVWLPYDLSRSTGNLAWDQTDGRFGPFTGQVFGAELTNGLVLRMSLEKVRGRFQGAAFAFRPAVGAANRLAFAPDGSLWCGLTSRGWGGSGAAHGLVRVRPTGETPMEIRDVHLRQDGFELGFTLPIAKDSTLRPDQVRASQYRYRYWWKYGSPEDDVRDLEVRDVQVAADGRSARLFLDDLRPGYVTRIVLDGVVGGGGHALLHPRFDYTLAELPEGPAAEGQVSTIVEAPKTREQLAARAVYLSDLWNTMQTWRGDGWSLGSDPALDPADPTRLTYGDSRHYLVCPDGTQAPLLSVPTFGPCTIRGEALAARGSSFALVLPSGDRLEIRPEDDEAGVWQPLEVAYAAPTAGAPARLLAASFGGRALVRGPVDLPGKTGRGPIGWVDARGRQVAFKNLAVTLDDLAVRDDGSLGDRATWRLGVGDWKVRNGVLVAEDALSSAVRALPGDGAFAFETDVLLAPKQRAEIRVLCSEIGIGGHSIHLNRSGATTQKTGSVGRADGLRHSLVAYDDTWFRVRVEVEPAEGGDRVRVLVNGVETADVIAPRTGTIGRHVSLSRTVREGRTEFRNVWLETSSR